MQPILISESLHVKLTSNMPCPYSQLKAGIQLLCAHNFQREVAINFGGEGLTIFHEVMSKYLGLYQDTWTEENGIRFCVQITSTSQDGIQLLFTDKGAKLQQLTSIFDVTTFSTIKEWRFL